MSQRLLVVGCDQSVKLLVACSLIFKNCHRTHSLDGSVHQMEMKSTVVNKATGKLYRAITNQHPALSVKTRTQQREVHDTRIVCTVFDEKARLGTK